MTPSLRIVFAGTPEFSVPALEALVSAGYTIPAVYTQPDRPAGRGQRSKPSAIKECAERHGIVVEQPVSLRDHGAEERLRSYTPDLMVVVAYGLLLPQAVLDLPRLGCLNIHASLLPRWRGAAPIQRAILAGDERTGVTIMKMEAGLDTGPMLAKCATPIGADETAAGLHDRLASIGAQAMLEILPRLADGLLSAEPQPADGVSYASKIRKEEALIDWRQSAVQIDRQVRAFNPWPVAETRWSGQQLRIWEARPVAMQGGESPGRVLEDTGSAILVATGDGVLALGRVQLAGRKAMAAADFVNAHSMRGATLGVTTLSGEA